MIELKQIEINKIRPNPLQPREHFDREKLKELSESILGNGLINPIQVRKKGNIYEIVAGERRWKAHQIANLNKILAVIKEYKNEGSVAIESLIENIHREDLTEMEKAKFLKKIAELEKIYHTHSLGKFKKGDINFRELSKRVRMNEVYVKSLLDLTKPGLIDISESVEKREITEHHFRLIKTIADKKERKKILDKIKREDLSSGRTEKLTSVIKKAPEEVKKSLFSDEITTQQAEDISKIHSPKAREQALKQVKQYRHIADIVPKLKERAEPEVSDALKRKFFSINRKIFEDLNHAKVSIIKANINLKNANNMLNQLFSKSFEYGLDKKTLLISSQQIKRISDTIESFNIQTDRFDELKETFVERIENKLEEER